MLALPASGSQDSQPYSNSIRPACHIISAHKRSQPAARLLLAATPVHKMMTAPSYIGWIPTRQAA